MCLLAAIIVNEEKITLISEGETPNLFPVETADFEEMVSRFDALSLSDRTAMSRIDREFCGRTRASIAAKNAGKRERKLEHRSPKRALLMAQVA
jgi:hypothetical protein